MDTELFRKKSIEMLSLAANYYKLKGDPRRYGYWRAIETLKTATAEQLNGNFLELYGIKSSIGSKLQYLRDNLGQPVSLEFPDSINNMADEMINLKTSLCTNPHKHYMLRQNAEGITYRLRDHINFLGCEYHITGSYRRGEVLVGDIDILVVNNGNEVVVDNIIDWCLDESNQTGITITAKGSKKLKLVFHEYGTNKEILECDVRFCDADELGTMLLYFTGPDSYNIMLRQRVKDCGYKLSEYGITDKNGQFTKFATEEALYKFLKEDYLPPNERS